MIQWIRGIAITLSVHGLLLILFGVGSAAWTIHHWRAAPTTVTVPGRPKPILPDGTNIYGNYLDELPHTETVPKPPLTRPIAGALLTIWVGLLQTKAGLRNLRYRDRTLGIVALLVGFPAGGMFGMGVSGLLLGAIGLYVYFRHDAVEIFRSGQGGSLV